MLDLKGRLINSTEIALLYPTYTSTSDPPSRLRRWVTPCAYGARFSLIGWSINYGYWPLIPNFSKGAQAPTALDLLRLPIEAR